MIEHMGQETLRYGIMAKDVLVCLCACVYSYVSVHCMPHEGDTTDPLERAGESRSNGESRASVRWMVLTSCAWIASS